KANTAALEPVSQASSRRLAHDVDEATVRPTNADLPQHAALHRHAMQGERVEKLVCQDDADHGSTRPLVVSLHCLVAELVVDCVTERPAAGAVLAHGEFGRLAEPV